MVLYVILQRVLKVRSEKQFNACVAVVFQLQVINTTKCGYSWYKIRFPYTPPSSKLQSDVRDDTAPLVRHASVHKGVIRLLLKQFKLITFSQNTVGSIAKKTLLNWGIVSSFTIFIPLGFSPRGWRFHSCEDVIPHARWYWSIALLSLSFAVCLWWQCLSNF